MRWFPSMIADTLVVNGKILQAGELVEGCVAFDEQKICYVGKEADAPKTDERIDVRGGIILPGFIDAHAHLRDMALAEKEDFYTGTCSALAGGFTTVLDMPNSIPPTDSPQHLNQRLESARSKIVCNVGFYAAFTADLENVEDIAQMGVVGFKVFTTKREPFNGDDDQAIQQALIIARKMGLPVAFHAEDLKIIERMESELKVLGESSFGAFALSHPPRVERVAVARIVSLARMTRARVHFCHLSTSEGLQLVKDAKREGLSVTCEVGPHHLFLADREVPVQGGVAIVDPPLRKQRHLRALFKGLVDGHIDIVADDHAPHTMRDKLSENVWDVSPGFPGLETTLPVMLTAVNEGKLTLNRLVEILAEKPAEVFGLRNKGHLLRGFDGDVTIVDLKRQFVIHPDKFKSKAKYSPFNGFKAIGKAVKTFVGGKLVMSEGEILTKAGSGSIVLRT
jgi:dihydroorotase